MKDLLAWASLKRAEARPGLPPPFQIQDPTETDLRNEYSFFLFTSVQIHALLDQGDASTSEAAREAIRKTLAQLEQQVYQLDLHRRDGRC